MGSVNREVESAKRRSDVVEWLNNLFPTFNLPLEISVKELRLQLLDGFVFFTLLGMIRPSHVEEIQVREYVLGKRLEYVRMFLSVAGEIGLPRFEVLDLEQGSMYSVVVCLLSLRDHLSFSNGNGIFQKSLIKCRSQPGERTLEGNSLKAMEVQQGEHVNGEENSIGLGEERNQNVLQLKFQYSVWSSVTSEPSTPLPCHAGHKFHEVFPLKHGQYSDLPAARISEMMKSNSLDSAPTESLLRVVKAILDESHIACVQSAPTESLLRVVKAILDESIGRKSGETPQRVACLLKRVVQEIERRITTQAQHIRNQNSLFKAREEKYQSRIRVLETLASGTSEETKIIEDQLQLVKVEKYRIEESKKFVEQDVVRLMNEKEVSNHKIYVLQKDLETIKQSYQNQQLEAKANLTKGELAERIKELCSF